MGSRFRKSFKIAPGVRVNLGKKSTGISIGGKHGGISVNSKTGARARVSAPGTGWSYSTRISGKSKKRRATPDLGPAPAGRESSVRQGPSKSAKERRINEAIRTRWLFAVFGIWMMALSILASAAHISVFVSVFTFLCSLFFLVYALYGFFKYWGREDED